MNYSQSTSAPRKLFVVPKADDRICIIRTSNGVEMELRGADVPSVAAVLLFFKKRKLRALQERNRSPLDRRERMARDFLRRFGKRGVSPGPSSPSIGSAPQHWWERGGTLKA
jgi:hypothetical protein